MTTRWTEKEINYLVKHWHKISNKEIAEKLGRTESAVSTKATKYITFEMMHSRHWSKHEDELLLRGYGVISLEELSNRLKRGEEAIKIRLRKLEGTSELYMFQEMYTSTEVAGFLGVSLKSISNYVKRGEISFEKDSRYYVIKQEVFWEWLKDNLHKPQYRTITEEYELNSPKWYRDIIIEKKRQLRNTKLNEYWSSKEDAILWAEVMKGTPQRVIGKMLNRSRVSVSHRLCYLSKKKMKVVN